MHRLLPQVFLEEERKIEIRGKGIRGGLKDNSLISFLIFLD
jgi:hypothetical protein